jgi:hypothetical protein
MAQTIHIPATAGKPFTRRAYLKGTPKLHQAVRFSFRPSSLTERYEFEDKQASASVKIKVDQAAQVVSSHITGWDLKDAAGRLVPISPTSLLNPAQVDTNLFLRLLNVVLGVELWDDDPDEPQADEPEAPATSADSEP